MGKRVMHLAGAAILIAGVSASMLGGASIAAADEPGTPGRDTTNVQTKDVAAQPKSDAKQPDSKTPTVGPADPKNDDGPKPAPEDVKDKPPADPKDAPVATDAKDGVTEVDETLDDEVPIDEEQLGDVVPTPGEEQPPIVEQVPPVVEDVEKIIAKGGAKGDPAAAKDIVPGGGANVPVERKIAENVVLPAADDIVDHGIETTETGELGDDGADLQAEPNTLFTSARKVVGDHPLRAIEANLALTQAAVAVPAPAPTGPTLINVLGTLAFGIFDFVTKILQGPPVVPAGSGLKVGRSDLYIDCGDGYTTEADWYFPEDGEAAKIIYFQHGILATSGLYNETAAELAERNNAIVVAPSITSNFFACDACNLSSDQMHAAVGALFTGDRVALTESARAAAEEAGVEFNGLPEQFVIAGHSAGGQLAAGAAGYYYEFAPEDEKANLVGVLLFDTSGSGGALGRALDKLPTTLPVLHIASNPSPFNTYGDANDVLEAKRPGQFNGVRMIDGSHSDAFRSSAVFGLAQVIVSLGTGASTPENVEANQVLAQGWISDMYEGTVYGPQPGKSRVGIYGLPNTVIEVPTPGVGSGVARAQVLPVPPVRLNPIDQLISALLNSLTFLQDFATCAEDPSAVFERQAGEADENSSRNASLSLDGRRQTVQSVGQHVCTG